MTTGTIGTQVGAQTETSGAKAACVDSEIVVAAAMSATSDVCWVTNDRIEALAAGHGMLNMAVFAVVNVVAEEILRGADINVRFKNARAQPVDDVLRKAIEAAKGAGADSANAALLAATALYLAGSRAQVGIPAGNRKLGATARMIAGADRCGVVGIPTSKLNSKISGFPAVQAVYQAMAEKRLSPIDGRALPLNVGGGPMYGHGALGEDIIYPAVSENGARIGTQAMLDAMAGTGLFPHAFTCALFGAAAILEIVHPDAEVAERHGPYGKINSAYIAGKAAAETAGLPMKLHTKITGEEYDTARLIGDLGLILKDIGGPSVIGMMAFYEMLGVFEERIAGSSGGPANPPLGHVCAYAVAAMKVLLAQNGDIEETARLFARHRCENSFDPENGLICINTVARKSAEIRNGPVTEAIIKGSEPGRIAALHRRAAFVWRELSAGRTLEEAVRALENERIAAIEANSSRVQSKFYGRSVACKLKKLAAGARRSSRLAQKYWSFDANLDVEVTCDGKTALLKGLAHEIVPAAAQGGCPELLWAIPYAAEFVREFYLAGNTIINVTVPAAVAAAMGIHSPEEAAETAERAAFVTSGIPGAKKAAEEAARLARQTVAFMRRSE